MANNRPNDLEEEYFRRGEILPGLIQLMVTVTGLRPSALGFTLSELGFPNHSSMQVGEDEFLVNFSPKSLFRENNKYCFLEDARNTEEGGMIEHDGLVFNFKASTNNVEAPAAQAQAAQAQAAQAQADQRALSEISALSHLQSLASQHFGEDPDVAQLERVIDDELARTLSDGR